MLKISKITNIFIWYVQKMTHFDPNKPFDLPSLPYAQDFETKEILKLVAEATEELGRLNGMMNLLPNRDLLLKPLMINEALQSSEIENIHTTTMKVLQEEIAKWETASGAEKEVLHYREALMYGHDFLIKWNPMYTNFIEEIQKCIEPNKAGIRKNADTVISKKENGQLIPIYTPPQGEKHLRDLLHNLDQFINDHNDTIHPLIKAGVIHYQFECIHPFMDGNGRTGRILIILYLIFTKKLWYPILFLSQYINKNKSDYYKIFQKAHETNDITDMIIFILKWIKTQSIGTSAIIQKIQELMHEWEWYIRDHHIKISLDITKFLASNPFVNITMTAKYLSIARQTAATYLKSLSEWSTPMLKSMKSGRDTLYFSPKFISLLS